MTEHEPIQPNSHPFNITSLTFILTSCLRCPVTHPNGISTELCMDSSTTSSWPHPQVITLSDTLLSEQFRVISIIHIVHRYILFSAAKLLNLSHVQIFFEALCFQILVIYVLLSKYDIAF